MTPRGPWMKSLLREPLLHFTLVAALLVGAHRLYSAHSRPEVKITGEWIDTLARDFELKAGRAPDQAERMKMAHEYLEEEILCREALKSGHVDDPRVRRALALSLRETIEPVVADPSDAELEDFRRQQPDAFRYPAGVSFEHASFARPEEAPAGLLEKLRAGSPPPSSPVRMPNPMPMTWLPQIEKTFGTAFASAILAAPAGEWTGPITSSRGVHFVKVIRRDEAREMTLDEVRPALVAKWQEQQRNTAVSAKVVEMRAAYRIELPADIPAP